MKYIIDLPDELYAMNGELCIPTRFGESPVKEWRRTGLNVKPYTEPDRKAIEDAQEEAWEFAKQVSIMKPKDKEECWGTAKYNTVNLGYSYKEAKARHEAWQLEKREEESKIRVGDEVEFISYHKKGIVLDSNSESEFVRVLCVGSDGYNNPFISDWIKSDVIVTGRHFSEAVELLKKMKENENEIHS